jgi:hypothetical protein
MPRAAPCRPCNAATPRPSIAEPAAHARRRARPGSLHTSDRERFEAPGSRYHLAYQGIRKRAVASQKGAMPTPDFARELVKKAFANPAPRIVRLGAGSDTLPKLARMPATMRDQLLSKRYELTKIR